MNVNRKPGNRNSWQEMDIESRQAVYLAEQLVEKSKVNAITTVHWRYATGATSITPK